MKTQSIRNHNKAPEEDPFALLTRNRLSGRWAVSTETLKRMESAGLLPCLKIGRGVRYRLADIERIEAEAEVR
jgi:hypothetical protein